MGFDVGPSFCYNFTVFRRYLSEICNVDAFAEGELDLDKFGKKY